MARHKLMVTVYLMLRRDNKILLLRRANTGYQDGNYGLVAGHLEGDETAKDGMAREALEEAAITVVTDDLSLVHVGHRLRRSEPEQERVDLIFETYKWQGEPKNAEPEVCDDLSWHDIDKLPDNMIPFVRLVIGGVLNGVNYSEYEEEPV